jgi:SRSO17 transposase
MVGRTSDWKEELGRFLKPFLDRLGHKARRHICPLYVSGLIGPGDRKSIHPIAERLAPGEYDQLHHFIAAEGWDARPVETELLVQADRLVRRAPWVPLATEKLDMSCRHYLFLLYVRNHSL